MKIMMIGSFIRNSPFGTEIAFLKGLRELGEIVDTWDPSRQLDPPKSYDADIVITFKDHGQAARNVLEKYKLLGIPTIIYQPDDIRAPGILGMMEDMLEYCDYAFTFDNSGAKKALDIGYRKAERLLVTADPDVYKCIDVTDISQRYDFCFIGSLSNSIMHKSRQKMIEILSKAGYNIYVENTFNVELINKIYNSSRVVLNHATDVGQDFGYGYGYQCRHFEAAMAGNCLLSNTVIDGNDDDLKGFIRFNSEEDLLECAELVINSWYDGWVSDHQGTSFYEEVMDNHSPAIRAKQILKFVESI